MGDAPGLEVTTKNPEAKETKLEIECPDVDALFWQAQPQSGPQQNYYYNDPSFYQQSGPVYQQNVGGQGVYVIGGPPQPVNVSGGRPAYRRNQPSDTSVRRNSEIFTDTFNSVAIRNRFVQRVFTILSIQLLFTFLFVLLCTFEKNTRIFFIVHHMPIMISSMIVFLVVYLALACVDQLRRNFPLNFILLALLTVSMTLMTMILVAFTSPMAVLAAMGTTAIVCFVISLFACQTKFDVTGCGMILCIGMIILMVFGLIIIILALCGIHMKILHIIYSALATILFSFWLMYDVQQIMGGRRYELSAEEYIFGALSLYIDIMYIFKNILVLYNFCMGD